MTATVPAESTPTPGSSSNTGDTGRLDCWEEEVVRHREIWQNKPMLRRVYERWFRMLQKSVVSGKTLEVGGGSGNLKAFWPEITSCDVVKAPWLDFQADGNHLPVEDGSFDNVVAVDVLHHLYDPDTALAEMARVIRPGGRAAFIEPYVSKFSRMVRGKYHHEEQDLERDVIYGPDKKPEEANLAIPTRLFVHNRQEFEARVPQFRILNVRFMDMLAYPLTGGFTHRALLPSVVLRVIHDIEPFFGPLCRWFGFKMLIVLEKRETA